MFPFIFPLRMCIAPALTGSDLFQAHLIICFVFKLRTFAGMNWQQKVWQFKSVSSKVTKFLSADMGKKHLFGRLWLLPPLL